MKKKIVTLLMVALTVLSVAGCGKTEDKTTSDNSTTTTDDAATTDDTAKTDDAAATDDTATADDTTADDTTGGAGVSGPISVISREDGSGTRGAFIELFEILEEDEAGNSTDLTTQEAVIANSTEIVLSNVAGDPNAIGYVSLGSLNDSVSAMQINGVDATVDNIKSGDYVISRPFNIATNGKPSEITQDFIDYIMSADGQKVVEDNGYIKTDENAAPYAGKKPEGKIVVAGSSSVSPVMEKLIEAYKAVNTSAEIELQTSDSSTGLQATIDGTCDIGMASRELKDSESALTPVIIAIDGIVVVANLENTTTDMTPEEVKSIFTGEKTEW